MQRTIITKFAKVFPFYSTQSNIIHRLNKRKVKIHRKLNIYLLPYLLERDFHFIESVGADEAKVGRKHCLVIWWECIGTGTAISWNRMGITL